MEQQSNKAAAARAHETGQTDSIKPPFEVRPNSSSLLHPLRDIDESLQLQPNPPPAQQLRYVVVPPEELNVIDISPGWPPLCHLFSNTKAT
ncbi:unnamed protein product [Hydatigera taeniaeformis]|uniref:Uncharacterized protein n=1 Tax=Hydatigena taeniaeformis TaxID=6205 RepID=A0A0R3WYN3_HYDTA|nr:unnamed protein product [Hydatigera taeniaeformis]